MSDYTCKAVVEGSVQASELLVVVAMYYHFDIAGISRVWWHLFTFGQRGETAASDFCFFFLRTHLAAFLQLIKLRFASVLSCMMNVVALLQTPSVK